MRQINRIFTQSMFMFSSKRVISLKPAKLDTQILFKKQEPHEHQHKTQSAISKNEQIPDDWQTMPFDRLCSLSSEVLNKLQMHIKKTKMNVSDQIFQSKQQVTSPQSQLTPYWVNIYKTLCNLASVSIQKVQKYQKDGYLAKMLLDEPLQDQKLLQVVSRFVNNIDDVKKLQGISQPTFNKYLLSLKRDLLMQGLNIQSHIDKNQKDVKIIKVLNYEYQFWSDVKHNRAKNGIEQDYIIKKQTIDNPNTTIVITEQHPKIDVTYISRKKKSKKVEMNFTVKMVLQIQVDGNTHLVKVEKKGPSNMKEDKELKNQYLVIDYDQIYRGNPTVRPIFQF